MNYKIFYPKNIYNNIKKLSLIYLVLIFFIIILFSYLLQRNTYESFENNNQYIHLLDNDIYDSFYCKYYDRIFLDKNKNKYEIEFIYSITNNTDNKVLDVGCGTGNHVNTLTEYYKNTIGIDQSIDMINTAKNNYPHCNYQHVDIFNINKIDNIESQEYYDIVTCLGKTIYCIQDKYRLLSIINSILQPDGIFFVHLIDKDNFLPHNNIINHNIVYNSQKYKKNAKINKFIIKFTDYEYLSDYNVINNDEYDDTSIYIPTSQYIEKFTNNNNKNNIKKYETNLYIPDNITIINIIKDSGFKYYKKLDLHNVGYDKQYIYAFIKK